MSLLSKYTRLCFLLIMFLCVLTGCLGSRSLDPVPDEQFGHRYEVSSDLSRKTVTITPVDSTVSYFLYPAIIDSIHVRAGSFQTGINPEFQSVPVEVLIKGSFPDACAELHSVRQERFGHIIHLELLMRLPRGMDCQEMVRPYRFYFTLEGEYRPGAYTLKINEVAYPFTVNAPRGREP